MVCTVTTVVSSGHFGHSVQMTPENDMKLSEADVKRVPYTLPAKMPGEGPKRYTSNPSYLVGLDIVQ